MEVRKLNCRQMLIKISRSILGNYKPENWINYYMLCISSYTETMLDGSLVY